MDPYNKPQKILSVCTGIGGLERGLHRAGIRTKAVAYVEIEAFILENIIAGMEAGLVDEAPVWLNAKTFPASEFYGKVDGIIGGYPCQPFSVAGNQKGAEDPRHLFPYLFRMCKAIRPVWCFFENVGGHLNLGFDEVYRSLAGLGYAVEAGLYSASETGAPHERERLFILAILGNTRYGQTGSESNRSHSREREISNKKGERTAKGNRSKHASKMDDSNGQRLEPQYKVSARRESIVIDGKELGNTSGEYERARTGELRKIKFGRSSSKELGDTCNQSIDKSWRWVRGESYPASTELANPKHDGFTKPENRKGVKARDRKYPKGKINACQFTGRSYQRSGHYEALANSFSERRQLQDKREQSTEQQSFSDNAEIRDRWPAPPGSWQHEWEEPRTIEPRVGSTVNGYNFREDLLRAFGNSVVEQTAAIAFRDLLRKHQHNH